MAGLPVNLMLQSDAYNDRLKALRTARGNAMFGETNPNLEIGPDQFNLEEPGIRRPTKDGPAAGTRAAALKAERDRQQQGRKAIKDDVKAKRKVQYPKKEYGAITIPVPRYTAAGQQQFGLTAATANNQQLANRAFYNFSGDGEYFRGNGMYMSGPGGTVMRHTDRFSGEGGFFDDVGNFFVRAGKTILPIAKDVARVAAPVIGNAIAPGIGGAVGSAAANAFLGEGAYELPGASDLILDEPQIKYNNLINSGSIQTKANAVIESAGDETGDLIFTHHEYIHDITSRSMDFHTIERFEINPGVFTSFPLLSQFAQHFEEYDFIQCIFEFKSLVTDGNATAAGSVMLCPNYNASNPNLPDKRSIENASGSVSGKVTSSLFCGIECANDKTAYGGIKYVRTVDVDSAGRRMYDLGFLQIAAQGVPANLAIGELWCRYKVRLSKMKVGALKIPALGSGFSLSANTGYGNMYFGALPGFSHTLNQPVQPVGAVLLAGDDVSAISLTDPDPADALNTRLLTASFAVIGGSQIVVTAKYSECWGVIALPTNVLYAGIDWAGGATDCTIPYTATRTTTVVNIPNPTGTSAMTINNVTTTITIVFGTPGQIGKMNLRVATAINSSASTVAPNDVRCSNWTIEAVRTA